MFKTEFGSGLPWAENATLPRDASGFVRRECPGCHRLFKVRETPQVGRQAFARLSEKIAHANAHEAAWPEPLRHCPYCRTTAPADRWFTAEQRAFLDQRGETLGQEVRYEQLAHVQKTLAVNPSPTYLPVRPEKPTAAVPADPDDMQRLALFCCLEEMKVSERWLGSVRCFWCGTEHEFGLALVRDRLKKILEP